MSSSSLDPQSCPPHAWRHWLREGWTLFARGLLVWHLPSVLVAAGLIALLSRVPWLFVGVVALSGTWMGLQMAVYDTLASGRTQAIDVGRTLRDDWKRHQHHYLRNMGVRGVAGLVLWAVCGPTSLMMGQASAFWMGSSLLVSAVLASSALRLGGAISFVPWLAWHLGLPTAQAIAIDAKAHRRNRAPLIKLSLFLLAGFLIVSLIPLGALILESLWIATLRVAYADIFLGGHTLRDVRTAPVTAGTPAAAAMS